MQIGYCGLIEESWKAKEAGFDFMECPLTSLRGDDDEEAFAPILEVYKTAALPVKAFNIFLPSDLRVVGPEVDEKRLERYTKRALERAKAVGAEIVVFGSGKSRTIPESFPREEAEEQLVHFLDMVADVAEHHGIVVVIEPLRKEESNIINTVAQGVALAKRVDHPSVKVLADFYHMDEVGEPLAHLGDYGSWLMHIHVADTGRGAPGTGDYPYEVFEEELRKAKYDRLISVECRWRDFQEEAAPAVAFLRRRLTRS
jgi:sugar phosphate isomerase/epimerase